MNTNIEKLVDFGRSEDARIIPVFLLFLMWMGSEIKGEQDDDSRNTEVHRKNGRQKTTMKIEDKSIC